MSPTQSSTAVPATFEDRAARGLDADEPELVRLGRVQVLVAREHLERPQAEEEDDENEERERAENRDAQRQLRCQAVRLADARIRRQEAPGRRALLVVRTGGHGGLDEDLDLGRRLRTQLL